MIPATPAPCDVKVPGPIGAITVTRHEANPFSPSQIALLETFASQAVIAVERGYNLYQANCAKCHAEDLSGWDSGDGHPAPPLTRVFERHSEASMLGILQHGIYRPTDTSMPPWQEGYTYQDARYTDDALQRIIDYLREQQEPDVDEDASEGEGGETLDASASGGA